MPGRCPTLDRMATPIDAEVTTLARRLADLGSSGGKAPVVQASWWSERMLEWAMSHPSFKTQLFRFVDVFPATVDDEDVMRHLDEYFAGSDVPKALDLGLGVAEHVPFGKAAAANLARRSQQMPRPQTRGTPETLPPSMTPSEPPESVQHGSAAAP